MWFSEAVGAIMDLNMPQALEFLTIGLSDLESGWKTSYSGCQRTWQKLNIGAENFIAISDAIGNLKQQFY